MEHCRLDGLLAYLYYGYDFEERELAKYLHIPETEIRHRVDAVVWWISGWNFYAEWSYRRFNVQRSYEAFLNKSKEEAGKV